MLVQPKFKSVDSTMAAILTALGEMRGDPNNENPEPGIFLINHWNLDSLIQNVKTDYPGFRDIDLEPYGVCDSIAQFLQRYEDSIIKSPRLFCVSFVKIRRKDQSPTNGWRWYKWGNYIGNQKPMAEYLFDEPLIEEVLTFHVYELEAV